MKTLSLITKCEKKHGNNSSVYNHLARPSERNVSSDNE